MPVDSSAYSEGVRDRAAAPGVGGVREPLLGEGEDRCDRGNAVRSVGEC